MVNDIHNVAIITTDSMCAIKAAALSKQLNLPFVTEDNKQYAYLLKVTPQRLELQDTREKNSKPIYVDFLEGKLGFRVKNLSKRNELIAKAVGIKANYRPKVLDVTAGLGQDAFILAKLGCEVIMVERSTIVWALLQDGLERLQQAVQMNPLKIKLFFSQSIDFINNFFYMDLEPPDVIYLDPMYPERSKSALGKKNMRVLHQVVGEDLDAHELLEAALKVAQKRVVVKRPKLAVHLSNKNPDLIFSGKSSRFDVYYSKVGVSYS